MSYTILKSNGTVLTSIPDGTINTTSTSLGLPGRNYAGYGQPVDENFVWLTENFADTTPPPNPLAGQLWFNTNDQTMYVCPLDGTSNAQQWLALTSTSSGGTTTFGAVNVTGDITSNNASVVNTISANAVVVAFATVSSNLVVSNANITTANIGSLITQSITSGSQATAGTLTGLWTANGAGTVSYGGPNAGSASGSALYVTGGNLVIDPGSTGLAGIRTDHYYYANGDVFTFAGAYGNANVTAFLPTYTGIVGDGTGTFRGALLTTGAGANPGSLVGTWTLAANSFLRSSDWANVSNVTVLYGNGKFAAAPTGSSYGDSNVANLLAAFGSNTISTTGTIGAGNITGANFIGNGHSLTGINGANVSIVPQATNAVAIATTFQTSGIYYLPLISATATGNYGLNSNANFSANLSNGYITATGFVGNGSSLTGIISSFPVSNGSSNIAAPVASGNINLSVGGNANILTVTGVGANLTGTANITGNANVGGSLNAAGNVVGGNIIGIIAAGSNAITTTGNITGGNLIGTHANGTSNVSIPSASGNVNISAAGNANVLTVTGTGANIAGTLNVTGNANIGNLGVSGNIVGTLNISGNISGNVNGNPIGYINIPQSGGAPKTTNYTATLGDAGEHIYYTGGNAATATTCSTSGNVLTVGGTITGTFAVGQPIQIASGTGILAGGTTYIANLGTGTGGLGTYTLNQSPSLALASATIFAGPALTIPSNANVAYPIGTVLTFINDSSANVQAGIPIQGGDNLVWQASGATGTRSLNRYGMAVATKVASTKWFITGALT